MQTTEIEKIVTNKVAEMINDGTLKKKIEQDVEQQILNSLSSAVKSWEIEDIIKKKLKGELSEELSNLSFEGYTNKVIEAVCKIVSIEENTDLTERVKLFYKDVFGKTDGVVKIQTIIDKYVEEMTDKKEGSCCYDDLSDYSNISVSYDEEHDWFRIKFITEEQNRYSSYSSQKSNNENYYELLLTKSHKNKTKYHILSVYGGEDRKDLTGRFSYKYYSGLEKYLLNLYLNQVDIEISTDDVCEGEEYSISRYD